MKRLYLAASLMLAASSMLAQDEAGKINLKFEARADFQQEHVDGDKVQENSGFKGNIINIKMWGDINDKWSYMYRQRLNGINKISSFFDATDWLYVSFNPTENISVSAGKWSVLTGCWEFEPAPIDCFQLGEFTYNFPCYMWGVWGAYTTPNKKGTFTLQLQESPFRRVYKAREGKDRDMYALGLTWMGQYGFYEPLWGVNFIEYAPKKYINYIGLGNRFHIGNKVAVDFDFMNRAAGHQKFLFKDYSVGAQVAYQPCDRLNLTAKVNYDTNKSGTDADLALYDGTEMTRVGGLVEFFPLRSNKNLRIHALYTYAWGTNTNPDATLVDKQSHLDLGVTWRWNILKKK